MSSIIAEGKTKQVIAVDGNPDEADFVAKQDITAGDGKKHDVIPNKDQMATRTTCNVFRLLQACGLPVAFLKQINLTTFRGLLCKMIQLEVVVRREAHGSFLKCYPEFEKGHLFPRLVVQFFLKTTGKKWRGHDLVCDDPLMRLVGGLGDKLERIELFDPKLPMSSQQPFLTLAVDEAFRGSEEWTQLESIADLARKAFLVLEKAWQLQGKRLVDFKVEFGLGPKGQLLLADVIDNDSWRVLDNDGQYIDKQVYRDGGSLDEVARKYLMVSELTNGFSLPKQQVVIWTGSMNDDVSLIQKAFEPFKGRYPSLAVNYEICSVHKEPIKAIERLQQIVQNVTDSVIIALIGRSNGAGPVLSAHTTVPVITVPESFKSFPDDVWSSLRTPSNVPVMTVLEQSNAVLAALNILSARSPWLYMMLRQELEKRLVNYVQVAA